MVNNNKGSSQNEWGNNLSFILAMIGSAVGLGNIWRYPYVLYSNGGGAFYIPYLVAVLLMGIPFLILEYDVGYNYKASFAKALKKINSKFEFLGWFLPVSVYMIMIYYSAILGWDGIYIVLSFFKGWGNDPGTYFETDLLKSSEGISGLLQFIPIIAISMLIGWIIIWFISHRDLESGLGKVSKILVPLLFIIMIFIVIYSLMLPGASIGLEVLFKPDWSLLLTFEIWMAAFGQIIFSLSLGMSIAFTYASYTKKETDLVSNTLSIAIANCLFENFAALGVFSILGYMSQQSGKAVSDLVKQGTSLVFVAYPTVFNVLGKIALVIGPLFFFTVYLAGLTSILSTVEPLSFCIQNKFGFSRRAILIGVVAECVAFGWIFDAKKLIPFLNERSKVLKLGTWWLVTVKVILPLFVSIIWVGGIIDVFKTGTMEQLVFTIISAVILLVATTIFTFLSSKSEEWTEVEDRV
ncbi:Na+-dependent transporter SNF family [Neocallimastix californiae]|uniref:Na+-dependent transporter SNF family n=1 Tax=Neocallimastix californiae TaxID=1754190 RepID=A0A1Y2F6Z3_9FUNG|nr:Na+-dependent transporter SNF family [Neocallimastix californiae]|eukprot:ORY79680.1 Na+-dependent transporter SNF family [Neocallimastix californiae]